MNWDELKRELDQQAKRIERIEERLGITDEPEADAETDPGSADQSRDAADGVEDALPLVPEAEIQEEVPLPPLPVSVDDTPAESAEQVPEALHARQVHAQPPSAGGWLDNLLQRTPGRGRDSERASEPEQTAEQPRGESARTSWELQIGMRWMAWAGAIVVVVAMGFFVKLAIDQGWWGGLPEWVKCLMTGGVGAVLIGLGELALRRVGRQAAVGLFSAGIGTLRIASG